MDDLAQASATNTRSALLTLGPDPVPCITIYNYQSDSRHCDSRSALAKHISFLKLSLSKINGLQNNRKHNSV